MNESTIDWKSLSPRDFERLCRDLFARLLGTVTEAFAAGADGGVDLRADRGRTIIQCKRYTGAKANLFRDLRTEAQKPAVRQAQRYLLAVTLPLTPLDKVKIRRCIPAIQNEADIFGADDLEGLLAQNRDLRALYPALWLGDAEYLQELIKQAVGHSIDYRSELEMEEIAESMQSFIEPPQADEALDILRRNKALIITGEPGIGKTTLARYLVWQLCMAEHYEPVYIDSHITEGLEKFSADRKQVFFFDDFLGSTMLNESIAANKGRNITAFIHKLHRSSHKLLILTTREYIFRQAGQLDEDFRPERAAFARYLLNMRPFDKGFKQKLITSLARKHHLDPRRTKRLFAERKHPRKKSEALSILTHPNFNPRVLDTALKQLSRATNKPPMGRMLLYALEHPYHLYENAFLTTLTQEQRDFLIVLGSMPENSNTERLLLALKSYHAKPLQQTEGSLRTLVGDFLTTRLMRDGSMQFNFVNPGVRDFIQSYYIHYPETGKRIINSAELPEQLFELLGAINKAAPAKHFLKEHLKEQVFRYLEGKIAAAKVSAAEIIIVSFMISASRYLDRNRKSEFYAKLLSNYLQNAGKTLYPLTPFAYSDFLSVIPAHTEQAINWRRVLESVLDDGFGEVSELEIILAVSRHHRNGVDTLPDVKKMGRDWCLRCINNIPNFTDAELQGHHALLYRYIGLLPQGYSGLQLQTLQDYFAAVIVNRKVARKTKTEFVFPPLPEVLVKSDCETITVKLPPGLIEKE